VIDIKSGYVVPAHDVEALVDKIQHLIEHPEQWSAMGQYVGMVFESKYYIKNLNQIIADIYQDLLKY
jgi:colanic acid/amylovoran biosynthesis glycosyltransferase